MDLFDKCRSFTRAQEAREGGWYPYFKAIESGADSEVMIDGRKLIMVGSNNYLGLTQDPRVKQAAQKAIEEFGSGCTGSRFLNGTLKLHEELEYRLAKFMKREAALCFSTGFQTNLGTIATLVGKDDVIFSDRANHASIVDGCRLSYGHTVKFKHNDLNDLERLLKKHSNAGGKLIVADGVFSMEGDIIDLPNLVKLAEKYEARIMLDDAHSIGVLGKHGRGTGEHFGLADKVDIVMGTFSKSFASLGGFIAGDAYVIDYVKHHARSLIFSASMPPAATATVLAALDIIEQEPERIQKLWRNVHKMKTGFDALGFDTGKSVTPIIPILVGEDMQTFAFWKLLYDNGIFTNPVITPAVPPGEGRIRTSYMATHTDEELDRVLETFGHIGREFGLIP
ncbi:MAG: pyridoxal phosphate-dependent aminotransferase family protein [candidate division KSB1 bacterium]|nr:pyridoxal phosphate-dependent aminotransferase family protein [candidate division KSB1 bacterium]MDZ7305009.1 pyridoxal phosphate-dependent aminotransferase family protein [candidate division KSB1 bacterium]MDZ7314146.1 pyridoxal phosphate-dependent aminotransferase family protein [candidate division KSB1 bacterium]